MLELLRFLLNYENSQHKYLQVILLGQNELAVNLESKKELKTRMYRNALASLTRDDMENMIKFRYELAGGKSDTFPFTKEALDLLFRLSLGLPRLVCQICDMALLRAYSEETKTINETIIKKTADQLAINEEERVKQEEAKKVKPSKKVKGETKE